MIKQMIITRLYQSTPQEIVEHGRNYGISVTDQEADKILTFIRTQKIDPFSEKDRQRTFQYISSSIDENVARKAEQLLYSLAKQFGMEHLL
ncbi:hypothetical protein CEY16_04460 [Halalkalibacillus sediminis]|uniref:DUF2624 domain-containing protein n=1 Tax=Halalkalibacillus sediminis TaxID=2018042 RepID=A0A2I0QXD9_9BACI|nr:DUF2624 family protein [Halalkalibacillus sediminis]PKR79007.1 hypothetical protein CEY16_04460 [Halalkalibacillus sediminis]